ncbi:unnamed protein product [Closterium sp. Yama58-4]|nr:unnamed protein product [Closterium sp. Yama58-4]
MGLHTTASTEPEMRIATLDQVSVVLRMPNQPLHACAACKSLRKKCTPQCVFSPYFPPNETEKWTTVHRTFGASNISKILTTVPPGKRTAAANSLIFEAEARLADPVYGTLQVIHRLGSRLSSMVKELQAVRAENEELRQNRSYTPRFALTECAGRSPSRPHIQPAMLRVRTSSSLSDSQSSHQSWRGWPAAASSVARRHATSLRRTLSVTALPLLLLAYVAVRLTIAPHYRSALTEPGSTTRKPRRVEALRVFIVPLDPAMSFGLLNSSSQLSLSIPARLVPTWNGVTGSNVPLPPSLALTPPAAAPPLPSAAALVQGEGGDDLGTAEEGSGEEKEEERVSVQVAAYEAEPHVYAYSAEYWLTLSLFTGLPAVRVVEQPSQADALFLPLFSSLLLLRSGPPNASAAVSLRTPPALLDSVLSYVASLLQHHQPARAPLPLLLPAVHAHALAPAKLQLASARFFLADFRHSSPQHAVIDSTPRPPVFPHPLLMLSPLPASRSSLPFSPVPHASLPCACGCGEQAVSVGKDVLVPLASPVPPVLDDTGEWAHRPTLAFFHGPPQVSSVRGTLGSSEMKRRGMARVSWEVYEEDRATCCPITSACVLLLSAGCASRLVRWRRIGSGHADAGWAGSWGAMCALRCGARVCLPALLHAIASQATSCMPSPVSPLLSPPAPAPARAVHVCAVQTQERVRLAAVLAGSMDFEVTVWGDVHSNEQHARERARELHGMRTAKFCLLLPGQHIPHTRSLPLHLTPVLSLSSPSIPFHPLPSLAIPFHPLPSLHSTAPAPVCSCAIPPCCPARMRVCLRSQACVPCAPVCMHACAAVSTSSTERV